jgi:hypothetical protein
MKKNILALLTISLIGISLATAEEGHNHGASNGHDGLDGPAEHKEHDEHDDHKEHDEHKDHEEEGHNHGGGKSIGKGKAIEEVDEIKGFKLSKEAIKTLSIKLTTVNESIFNISKKTLVASKNKKGVYRFRAGFFKFLPAKILKEEKEGYRIEVKGIAFGDQIVVEGIGLLRVTDVYSTDKSEYGHSH